ncbi:hypothetical protein SAMN03159417_04147 [Ralstonia sp. NFACC01]|nr:hypothetical protein SAMN03159417_04147 [Ralstonia sp. NFACC01]
MAPRFVSLRLIACMTPPALPALHVELTTPQTVDGRRAPFQSLWLLVRLAYAHRLSPEQPLVRLADLRGAVSDASTQRMMISRAFRDWQNWGVQAGWGEQRDREPRFLNADKRSQGPFWLTPEDAARVVCVVEGRIADDADVRAFLGIASPDGSTDNSTDASASALSGPAPGTPNPAFWHAFLTARHAMREGRLLHALSASSGASDTERGGALLALRHAGDAADNDFQRALVTLGEAMAARRLGDSTRASALLSQLRAHRRQRHVLGNDYLAAMERIVTAWCAYDRRDLDLAAGLLARLADAEPGRSLLRYHPQIRFEWNNLSALIERARLLYADADGIALDVRAQAAQRIVAQFETALAAALESQASDAVQQVAANLGMTCWLLRDVLGNSTHADGTVDAVRWLAMSEWQALRNGGPLQSAWNAIALMRIARADRHGAVLTLADLRTQAGPFAEAFDARYWPQRWTDVAALRLREHDSGRHRYGHVQVSGLLLELAWFAHVDGDHLTARTMMDRLSQAMQDLAPHDRAYFVQALKQLMHTAQAAPSAAS